MPGNDGYCKLMLHCNTTKVAHPITGHNSAQIITAQKKFGTGSIDVTGTKYLTVGGDSFDTPLTVQSPPWGIDFWYYRTQTNMSPDYYFGAYATDMAGPGNSEQYWYMYYYRTSGYLGLAVRSSNTENYFSVHIGTIADETWIHFAVMYTSDYRLFFFKDGTAYQCMETYGPTLMWGPQWENLKIGAVDYYDSGKSTYQGSGYIDELRFVTDVCPICDSDDPLYIPGSDPMVGFTPPTSAYSSSGNTTNTILLLHGDGSNGSTTFTDDANGAQLNFSTNLVDSSRGGNHTPTIYFRDDWSGYDESTDHAGWLTQRYKKFGNASLQFMEDDAGSGPWVGIPDSTDWELGSSWGIDFWGYNIYANDIYFIGQGDNQDNYWYFGYDDADEWHLYVKKSGSVVIDFTITDTDMYSLTWYHIALMYDGTKYHIYRDGAHLGSLTSSETIGSFDGELYLNRCEHSYSIKSWYLDELRLVNGVCPINVYDDPLYIATGDPTDGFTVPDSEYEPNFIENIVSSITCLLPSSEGEAVFNGGNTDYTKLLLHCDPNPSFDCTPVGVELSNQVKKFGNQALYFDGDGYLIIKTTSINIAYDCGLDCWIYPTGTIDNYTIFFKICYDYDNRKWHFLLVDANTVHFIYRDTTYEWSGVTINTNQWQHISLQKDDTNEKLYLFIDGVYQGEKSYTVERTEDNWSYIGATEDGDDRFQGYIDEFRFVREALPLSQSSDPLYIASGDPTDGFTPPSQPYSLEYGNYITNEQYDRGTLELLHFEEDDVSNIANSGAVQLHGVLTAPTNVAVGNNVDFPVYRMSDVETNLIDYRFNGALNIGGNHVSGGRIYIEDEDDTDDELFIGNGDFSVDCWLYQEENSDYLYDFFQKWSSYRFYFNNDNDTFGLVVYDGSSWTTFSASATIDKDTWYHVLICRHDDTLYLFLDGVLIDTADMSGITIANSSTDIHIGHRYGYSHVGIIDEFRYCKGACVIFEAGDPLYIESGNPSDGFDVPTTPYLVSIPGIVEYDIRYTYTLELEAIVGGSQDDDNFIIEPPKPAETVSLLERTTREVTATRSLTGEVILSSVLTRNVIYNREEAHTISFTEEETGSAEERDTTIEQTVNLTQTIDEILAHLISQSMSITQSVDLLLNGGYPVGNTLVMSHEVVAALEAVPAVSQSFNIYHGYSVFVWSI